MANFKVRPGWMLKVALGDVDDQASALLNGNEILGVQVGEEKEFQQRIKAGDVLDISLSDTHRPFFAIRYRVWLGPHVGGYPIVDAEFWGHSQGVSGEVFRRRFQFTS